YHSVPHISHAIDVWIEADVMLENLRRLGSELHAELTSAVSDRMRVDTILANVDALNDRFPILEDEFSRSLGDAARYGRSVVFNVLVAGALLALSLGLFVSYRLIGRANDADEQYRHLFETASDAVIIAEHETGIILDANMKLAELTGLSQGRIVGADQQSLFGREIPAVHGSSDLETGDLVIRHVSGSSIPVDVRTSQGRFGRRVVDYSIVRDIRERRRTEEKLQEAARMESVGRLAGGVAHDFNNLLTVIASYTQALQRTTEGETKHKVDRIRNAAERAATLVRQLLAFSRKQPLVPQALDLNLVIRSMSDMIAGVLDERVELALDLAPGLHIIEADPFQIEQILLNLSTNARDAMPGDGVLTIKTWNEDDYVGLSVSDTGLGMDAATQSRMFEPFFTTKPQGKGTGLGLATVFGVVKQSHGLISVESELGRGTSIRILLPISKQPMEGPRGASGDPTSWGSETVLLVEDDAAVRQALAHGLEQEGYTVLVAANGREGLDQFTRHANEVAVVVTDLVMPEMGGIALGEQLRALGATVPMVYASGYYQDVEAYPPEQLPLCGRFLQKPFSSQTLALTIRRVLTSDKSPAPVDARPD
ncbi:MAG TPA: ATP-binding protein, partial [Bryobacteraceae bacterium]|nr:ATP-binding protein [Bryobacteraceae bacterium]